MTAPPGSTSGRRSDVAVPQLRLLGTRRLLPLFIAQFLGAVNDNLFKNALIILIAYQDTSNAKATEILVTLAGAIFILPYFLFSATAGQIADKFEKQRLVQIVKLWEIGVMLVAALGFALDSILFQMAVLFGLGVQAAYFGPVKYAIIPELLAEDELMSGNALIEAGTFLAILIGTIAGGLLILTPHGPATVAAALLTMAVLGWGASLYVPRGRPASPELKFNPNILSETGRILDYAYRLRDLRLPLLGISWFWFLGIAYLSQFPNYAKETLGASNEVVTLFLTLFSVGIGVGALLCGRIQRGRVDARLVPLGALGLTVFGVDFWLAGRHPETSGTLVGAAQFLAVPANWRIVVDLFAIAVAGGLYCVPLYAIMQLRSESAHRARVVAANNIMNALFMVLAGIVSVAMLAAGLGIASIFLMLGVASGVVALVTWRAARA
jgi:acyl-[acyl-carrier-protein]-phospholipid O-acyltransferase/long-chain-fatty-acid--[acyl-carrier-protein] ligase